VVAWWYWSGIWRVLEGFGVRDVSETCVLDYWQVALRLVCSGGKDKIHYSKLLIRKTV